MDAVAFYLIFLLGLGAWVAGYFWDNNQQSFILHMFSFGFSLLASIGSLDVTRVSAGETIQSSEPILGAIALGMTFIAGGCAVYRAGRTMTEQRGIL